MSPGKVPALYTAIGGPGIPFIYSYSTVRGQNVMITDPYGPYLEEVFIQSGRYFSL